MSILNRLFDTGVVAVVRRVDEDKVLNVIEALIEGGVIGIELTLDSPNPFQTITEAKKKFGSEAIIGAGTVLDAESTVAAISAGAEFIVAPTLKEETIRAAKRHGKIVIPGAFTPTEILQAHEWGADAVKVFPSSVLGPKFIKDVRGPLGHIQMMTTGGIDLHNIGDFIQAGVAAVGVGGSLLNKDYIQNQQWDKLTQLAKQYTTAVAQAKAEK
ncbi:bifunctional 4-hydroxy-2-oxoglutarate aldolase/2-dehydro-3-deoxy-phosphogluconate aldolase [Bacillus dakarensis]|uniref:bifunctional 4-hydroxy-2-oxoglutarate aldolase/2-dehydro-3-deoxy-phosphogluconate aldolase n=1 Tax=Robertmurraya dakarensis TaxID=1926278 RepID=UPI00098091FF|nr:bifunctional 4-hydroxy-2-oxoglutarate aldolase/2-dehydro-3-deoxy-phosphogluconate aldolase [Bacillus dakarensis]